MRAEGIRELPPSYDPLKQTGDHPAKGNESTKREKDHAKQVRTQWRRSAGASGMRVTREHFARIANEAEVLMDDTGGRETGIHGYRMECRKGAEGK